MPKIITSDATSSGSSASTQVNADWESTSGVAEILNKPTINGTNTGDETATSIGSLINGATTKPTPVDADMIGVMDSASSNVLKKLSWINIKTTLKTYFDSLYSKLGHTHTASNVTDFDTEVSNNTTVTGKFDKSGGTITGDITVSKDSPIVDIKNINSTDVSLILNRNINASWKFLASVGHLHIQNDWTGGVKGLYFDVIDLAHETGNAVFKGSVTAPSFIGSLTGNASTATNSDTVDNLHGVDFSRYKKLTTLAEVNNASLEAGIYSLENVSVAMPDYTCKYYMVIVGKYSGGGFAQQIWIPYESGTNKGIYMRIANNTTWGAFRKIAMTDELPTSLPANGGNADTLDNKNSTDFAFNAYLGTVDLNTVIQSGMYRVSNNLTNAPSGVSFGQLLVIHGGLDTITQIISDYASTALYWRSGNPTDVGGAGSWGNWQTIWHSGNDGAGSGLDADTIAGKHMSDLNIPFVVGTQTVATNVWVGTASDISALTDGTTIRYWLPYAGNGSNVTLNLTLKDGSTTGAIACYYGGTARLTTHYMAGSLINMTYVVNKSVSGTLYTGWWADANYADGNNYDKMYWGANIRVGAIVYDYKLLMESGVDGNFYPLTLEEGTGTTKTVSTQEFLLNSPILLYNSTTNVSAGGIPNNLYSEYNMSGLNYTANISAWTAYLPIYLKGKINANGNFVLDNTSYTSWLTQNLPTTEDGFVYIMLGYAYSTNGFRLLENHPIYEYADGSLRQYVPAHNHSSLDSPSLTGTPTSPTAVAGTNTTQIATTQFVQSALSAGGYGDMLKSVYDTDGDGVVDNAEKLGGKDLSYFYPTEGASQTYDLNNCISTGIYNCNNSSTNRPPDGTAWGSLYVSYISHNLWLQQLWIGQYGNIFVRTSSDNAGVRAWNSWQKISKSSSSVNVTVLASGWSGASAPYTNTITVSGVTATNNVELVPQTGLTVDQIKGIAKALIATGTQTTNSITLYAYGAKPSIDLPITAIVRGD